MPEFKFRFVHLPVRYAPNWKGDLVEIGDRAILCNGVEVVRVSKEFWEQAKHDRGTYLYLLASIRKKLFPVPPSPNIPTVEPPY